MKAIFEYKESWETENWLRLYILWERSKYKAAKAVKFSIILLSLVAFLFYRAATSLLLIIKVILFSENEINRIERDESWIFRQLK